MKHIDKNLLHHFDQDKTPISNKYSLSIFIAVESRCLTVDRSAENTENILSNTHRFDYFN